MTLFEQGWHRQKFRILVQDPLGYLEVDGIQRANVPLGLHFRDERSIDVTHLLSGKRVAEFCSLGAAMEFVHRVSTAFDWFATHPAFSEGELHALYAIVAKMRESAFKPRSADGLDEQLMATLRQFSAGAPR